MIDKSRFEQMTIEAGDTYQNLTEVHDAAVKTNSQVGVIGSAVAMIVLEDMFDLPNSCSQKHAQLRRSVKLMIIDEANGLPYERLRDAAFHESMRRIEAEVQLATERSGYRVWTKREQHLVWLVGISLGLSTMAQVVSLIARL